MQAGANSTFKETLFSQHYEQRFDAIRYGITKKDYYLFAKNFGSFRELLTPEIEYQLSVSFIKRNQYFVKYKKKVFKVSLKYNFSSYSFSPGYDVKQHLSLY